MIGVKNRGHGSGSDIQVKRRLKLIGPSEILSCSGFSADGKRNVNS